MSYYLDLSFQLLQTASIAVCFATALALVRRWLESSGLGAWTKQGSTALVTGLALGAVGVLTYHIPVLLYGVKAGFGQSAVVAATLVGGISSGAITGTIIWGYRVITQGTLAPFAGIGLFVTWLCTIAILMRLRRLGRQPGIGDVLLASSIGGLAQLFILSAPTSPLPLNVVWSFGPIWIVLITATAALLCGTLFYFERERTLRNALATSEERHSLLIDASHEGMFDRNMVTGEVWRSERAQQITGAAEGSTYQDLVARVHPDDIEEFEASLTRAKSRRDRFLTRRYRLRMSDGSWRWIDSEVRLVYSDDGTLLRMVGSMSDVTDRVLAEEASRTSEARFSAAFQNSADAMFITRLSDGVHIASNDAAVAMVGWQRDELFGKTSSDLNIWVNPGDIDHIRESVRRDGVLREYPVRVRTKSGDIRDVLATCSSMVGDGEPCMLSIARDVTDSLAAKRRLAELNVERDAHLRRLRDITDNIPILIAYSDRERRLRFINRLGERWLNRPAHEIIGRTRDELMTDMDPTPSEIISRIMVGDTVRVERTGRYPDGVIRDVEMTYVSDLDDAGRVRGYYILSTDITERKAKDVQLQQAQKIEAIGRLAGGIAHDFNNMIGTIIGFNSFLVDDLPPGSEDRKFAIRIAQVCEHAKQVVNQILDFSRAAPTDREPLDLRMAVEGNLALIEGVLPASTRVTLTPSNDSLPVMANKGQFYQVLLNLCKNASDAFNGASGRVMVELAKLAPGDTEFGAFIATGLTDGISSIACGRLDPGKQYAVLRVSDDGCGMDQRTLDQAFEPFFTTKRRGVGTGLGLAVLHGIIATSEGAYRVTSRPGSGSTFSIYLPISAAPRLASLPRSNPIRQGDESILIVDDDSASADVLAIGLERLGYEVTCCYNPLEALQAFKEDPHAWAAVITDENMPELTGRRLAARLKAIRSRCPVILCTGLGVAAIGSDRASVDAVFDKPAHPGQLAEALRCLLSVNEDTLA